MLAVSVLGPVELRRGDQRVAVRPGKTTEVLVRLALDAGTLVRTERLIEDLWAGAAVKTGRNTLQSKVSALRRALGDAARVTGTSAGYVLEVERDAVDAFVVVELADCASAQLTAGDIAGALETSTTALARFRGEVLCDAGDGDWLTPHRVRLEEVRLRLLEDNFAARVALGAAGEIIAELEALVADYPLRERLWESLVTALYRDGRQADALAAYTRVRALLVEELGLEPGTALRALEQRVLVQDAALDGVARARGNVPPLSAPMIGREQELAALVSLVHDQRLVTVVGPAGVGKTRIAIEVARGFECLAGAWFVRLDSAEPGTVLHTIADALGVADGTETKLLEHFRGSDALLVLDNCEHVVDAVAVLAPRLLESAPALRVLCTSQTALGVEGDHVFPLDPLPLEASVELFAQRAQEHRASFAIDRDTTTSIEDVCRSLDGLPLAIELAAARVKTLAVADIARRLDDRFALLRDPSSRRPARQRALAAALAWSYDLLFPDDQRGLWALACFAGGAPLPAVEHVLAALDVPSDAALDVVTRLVDRSLVTVDLRSDGSARYRLLDSVRAFARERLEAEGREADARDAHAGWYGDAAAQVDAGVRGPDQARHLVFTRTERANIDAALASTVTHDPGLGLRIVTGFGWAWVVIGDGATGAQRLRDALSAVGDNAPAADRARAWSLVAWLEAGNNVDDARDATRRAIAIAADDGATANARLALGFVLIQAAEPDEAIKVLSGCRAEFARLDQAWEEGACCVLTAHAALLAGDVATAARVCADAERLVRPLGDDWGLDHLDAILGQVARADERFADAAIHLERAADAAHRLGFATSEGYHRVNLALAQHLAGDDDGAIASLERAIEIGRSTGELRVVALAQVGMGRVLVARGALDAARTILEPARAWYATAGGGEGENECLTLLAAVADRDGSSASDAR